ncbi:hypothetical protein H4W81_003741 [Nonomuraea africana]|uniref:Uncharacterized protein n=1 Tax=Nonomuraea africana TaxID=46171 RepID=A0ABR9KG12_9ACTN|nr:hypothetical protein [Nonomuraea africana]
MNVRVLLATVVVMTLGVVAVAVVTLLILT